MYYVHSPNEGKHIGRLQSYLTNGADSALTTLR